MASVAIEVAPPARRRAAQPKGPAFQQILRWVGSGFSGKERPTKKAIRLLLVTSILGVIVLSGLGAALYAYNDYRIIREEATDASQMLNHLADDLGLGKGSTKTKLDAVQTKAALDADLGRAMRDLQDVHNRLQHPDFVLSLAGTLPSVRDKLKSGLVLSEVGIDVVSMLQELTPNLATVANLLITSPIATTSTDNTPLLESANLPGLARAFDHVQPIVAHMVQTLESTPPDVLVAALTAKQQGELMPLLSGVSQLPTILSIVSEFLKLPSAPALLGAPTQVAYLIMTLDNTELRPVGGFQGQYAVVGVNGAHVGHISLEDVYNTLEPVIASDASGQAIQAYNGLKLPQQSWYNGYADNGKGQGLGWALRNSGLSSDFTQSARYALWYLHNETICDWTNNKIPVGYAPNFCVCPNYLNNPNYKCIPGGDRIPLVAANGTISGYSKDRAKMAGVIMIQEKVIEQLLDVVGPLKIGCPYNVTVNSGNLQDKIHFYQETQAGRSQGKKPCSSATGLSDSTKRFTALLTQALQAKLKTLPKTQLFKFAGDLINDLHTKDIQVYLTDPTKPQNSDASTWYTDSSTVYPPDPAEQKFLEKYQISSEMYHGADDSLTLNRSDMTGWKLERWIKVHLVDHVQIDSQGIVTHNFQAKYDIDIPEIKIIKDQNGNVDYNQTNQAIFSTVYNASFGYQYVEYWRLYTNQTATYLQDNILKDQYYPLGPQPSTDFDQRAYFQGVLNYYANIDPNSPTVQWGYNTGGDSRTPVPNVVWQVTNVEHNGKYSLHVQPQSGVDTDIQIDITGPCGKKTWNQPLTTNTVLTVPTAHC
ncbi:MAG: hypothetical protein H0X24_06205 [Ktedonobacterales bacterium]|nr:hypothetical protein [Ktedonobacterales bacterium]